jgi:hypothetical protein
MLTGKTQLTICLVQEDSRILHELKIGCQDFARFIRYSRKSSEDRVYTLVFVVVDLLNN